MLVLLLGGARSGKSELAVHLASASGAPVTFIATAEPRDREMAERIARHRAVRPPSWETLEEPLDLPGALAAAPARAGVVVDCLTLWVANALEARWSTERIEAEARRAAAAATDRVGLTAIVSNEVGMGVVPRTELGRRFRDLQGRVNAVVADAADRTELVVAGRVMELTSAEGLLEAIRHG